jgi:hypothetical protein
MRWKGVQVVPRALLIADAALFVGLALASVIFLTTILLVAAIMLRSHWEHMGERDNGPKRH